MRHFLCASVALVIAFGCGNNDAIVAHPSGVTATTSPRETAWIQITGRSGLSSLSGSFGLSRLSGLFSLSRLFGFSGSSNKTNQMNQRDQMDQITRQKMGCRHSGAIRFLLNTSPPRSTSHDLRRSNSESMTMLPRQLLFIWSISSVWFVWSVSLTRLNKANSMN